MGLPSWQDTPAGGTVSVRRGGVSLSKGPARRFRYTISRPGSRRL